MRASMLAVVAGALIVPSSSMAQEAGTRTVQEKRHGAEMRRAMQDPDYVFERMDTNKDGVISRVEFKAAHAKVRQRMSERHDARMERRKARQP